jgi:probable phosphoglycerate mutase
VTRRLVIEADGGSRGNPGPAGYGAVVRDADTGALLAERAGFLGIATNNVAEYNGLIAGAEAARAIDPDASISVRLDSKLVVEQMSGRWKIKHPDMQPLALRAREVLRGATVTFEWIPRERNKAADALANEAMDTRLERIERDHVAEAVVGPEYDDEVEVDPKPASSRLADLQGRVFVEPLTVVFVRHGVTDMTTTHVLSGSSVEGPSLNAEGRIQAAKAADAVYRIGRDTWDRVARPDRIIASPMVRTQDTAAAIGRRIGAHVETDARVREVDFGQWEGITAEQAIERDGDLILRWQEGDTRAPAGEAIRDVFDRMRGFLEELARQHARDSASKSKTVVVVSHAVAIKSGVGAVLGFPPHAASRMWPLPASLSIVQLRVTPQGELAEGHLLCMGAPTD